MPTITDVANRAGVSIATVSHVINKTRKVNPETVVRVEEAIQALHFRPNVQARSLKTGLSRQIGVMNMTSVDPYFAEVLCGIEQAASEDGYGVLIEYAQGCGHDYLAEPLSLLISKGVDGLIINSVYVTENALARLREITLPCVLLQFHSGGLPMDYIHNDDENAAYEATRYLISLGHTRIACIGGYAVQEHSAYRRRIGYERALQENNIPLREDFFILSDFSIRSGYECFRALHALPERPTACITYSDMLAMGAIRAAHDLGLSVPGDISILGFDDIAIAGFMVPRLTTLCQEKASQGVLAFHRVRDRINDPALGVEEFVLPSRLVIRESCGPAPAQA